MYFVCQGFPATGAPGQFASPAHPSLYGQDQYGGAEDDDEGEGDEGGGSLL